MIQLDTYRFSSGYKLWTRQNDLTKARVDLFSYTTCPKHLISRTIVVHPGLDFLYVLKMNHRFRLRRVLEESISTSHNLKV